MPAFSYQKAVIKQNNSPDQIFYDRGWDGENPVNGKKYFFSNKKEVATYCSVIIGPGQPISQTQIENTLIQVSHKNPDVIQQEEELVNRIIQSTYSAEKRIDAQGAVRVMFLLPRGLSLEAYIKLLADLLYQFSQKQGVVILAAIHFMPHNPHVHLYKLTRRLSEKGVDYLFGKHNDPEGAFGLKARDLNTKAVLYEERELTAEIINKHLKLNNIPSRVSEKSHKKLGIREIRKLRFHKRSRFKNEFQEINTLIRGLNSLIKKNKILRLRWEMRY